MSTSVEKIQSIADTLTTIKKNIDKKVGTVKGKITELQQELDALEQNAMSQSQEFINEKKENIQNKINDLTKKVEDWMQEQLDKAQEWMDTQKEAIENNIKEVVKAKLAALSPA